MLDVHKLLGNRRILFALVAIVLLFTLIIHLSTRTTPTTEKPLSQASVTDELIPQQPNIPIGHPMLIVDEPEDPTTGGKGVPIETKPDNETDLDVPRRYHQLILIFSDYRDLERRRLLRRQMLGVRDNLQPCMRANGDVFYKFAVHVPVDRPQDPERLAAWRNYQAEEMEYGDVLSLKADSVWDAQVAMLHWINELKRQRRPVSFDHLIYMDAYVYMRLDAYIQELESNTIAGNRIRKNESEALLLGDLEARTPRVVIMGETTAFSVAKLADEDVQPGDNVFSYFYVRHATDEHVHYLEDKRIYPWENAIEYLPTSMMAVTEVFLTEDFMSVQRQFPIQPPVTCRRPMKAFNLALVTSAHIFSDNCMIDAGVASARVKREYAVRHKYSFVARALEYEQQARHRRRHPGWGRLDVLEKVLPKYDWVLWTDMDAILVNRTVDVQDLIHNWETRLNIDFSKKHLVVSQLPTEEGIDMGVMLIRNSEWSRKLLRRVQGRRELYNHEQGVQKALWSVLHLDDYIEGVLLLNSTDHSLSTTPDRYRPGDFIVHYVSETCPGEQVLAAIRQSEETDHSNILSGSSSSP